MIIVNLSTLVNLANVSIFQLPKELRKLEAFLNEHKIILEEERYGVYTLTFPTYNDELIFKIKYAHIL